MSYDERCADVARVFIADRYPELNEDGIESHVPRVAQAIQDALEAELEYGSRTVQHNDRP